MLRMIEKTENLIYPVGDTFAFSVEPKVGSFADGSTLELIISRDIDSEPLIDNTYSLAVTAFNVDLSESDRKKLTIGNYIYKFILKGIDGTVFTQLSGNLYVTWEA